MTSRDQIDIDFAAFGRLIARFWWVVVVLAALGAALAVGVGLAQGDRYQASTSVYLGQSTDANGNPISSLNANPRAAAQILQTQQVVSAAARKAGEPMTPSRLRRGLQVEIPPQPARTSGVPNNLVIIYVSDADAGAAARAANALARILTERMASLAKQKTALLNRTIHDNLNQLEQLDGRAERAEEALARIAEGAGSAQEKAVAGAPYLTILQSVTTVREAVATELRQAQLQLLVARGVEQPSVVNLAATPKEPVALSWVATALIGALGGAVVGIVVAVVLARRSGRRPT